MLLLVMLSLQSCISVKISNDKFDKKQYENVRNTNLTASGTYFENGNVDKDWSNQNSNNSTHASFRDASGISFIKLKANKNVSVQFHHLVKLEGKIKFEVINSKNEVVLERDLNNSIEENFNLELNSGEYVIRWEAKKANGFYFLEWKQK